VLVLDEANERAIAETLVRVAEGRTAILITHRASLARIAHQTVTLPGGAWVPAGTSL